MSSEIVLTYSNQPNNVGAWSIGEACSKAKPGGDYIDHGLSLLQELQDRGYGIVPITDERRRALDPFAPPSSATPGDGLRLWDSQWVNIVNHANCYRDCDKEEAVAQAVKLTEQAMAKNHREGFPPQERAGSDAGEQKDG